MPRRPPPSQPPRPPRKPLTVQFMFATHANVYFRAYRTGAVDVSLPALRRIAKAFGVPLTELLG